MTTTTTLRRHVYEVPTGASIQSAMDRADGLGGGIVVAYDGARDTLTQALTIPSSVHLLGESKSGTIIPIATSDAAIKVASSAVAVTYPKIERLTINDVGTTPTGVDARGMTRLQLVDCVINNFDTYAVRFGASGYATGWTNEIRNCNLNSSPTCVDIGASANWITIRDSVITPTNASGSIGVNVGSCDSVRLLNNDISYAAKATAIYLRTGSSLGYMEGNRHEAIASDNSVIAHPIEIEAGAVFHMILGDLHSTSNRQPWVNDADPLGNRTIWMPNRSSYSGGGSLGTPAISYLGTNGYWDLAQDMVFRRGPHYHLASGDLIFDARKNTDANRRMSMSVNGFTGWYDPATGNLVGTFGIRSVSTGVLELANGGQIAVGNYAALPTASASYRNVIATVQGGAGATDTVYICLKSAADTYSWRSIVTGG